MRCALSHNTTLYSMKRKGRRRNIATSLSSTHQSTSKAFPIFRFFRSDAHGKFLNLGKMFNLFPHYQPLFPAFKSYSNDAI